MEIGVVFKTSDRQVVKNFENLFFFTEQKLDGKVSLKMDMIKI